MGDAALWCNVVIDVAAGLQSDTDEVLSTMARAELTVTFHRVKIRLGVAQGPFCCGKLVGKDIGRDPFSD